MIPATSLQNPRMTFSRAYMALAVSSRPHMDVEYSAAWTDLTR